jgi:hypothetical protein
MRTLFSDGSDIVVFTQTLPSSGRFSSFFILAVKSHVTILIPPNAPYSSPGAGTWPVSGRRTKWTQSHLSFTELKEKKKETG